MELHAPPSLFKAPESFNLLPLAPFDQMCKRKHNDLLRIVRNSEKVSSNLFLHLE